MDTDQFRRFLDSDADRLQEISKAAHAAGCLHHRFGVGDGFVLGSDEIAEVMREAGAQSEPAIEFTEAVESPDQF